MRRRLLDTFVLPNLSLVEAASQPTASQVKAASLSLRGWVLHRPDALGAGQAHPEVMRADVLGADGVHGIVVGAAGMGKTTLLRYLAHEKAKNKDYFPIFLPLRTLRYEEGEPWTNLISVAFRKSIAQMRGLSSEDIRDLEHHVEVSAPRGRVALFLDGLDEMEMEARDRMCRLVTEFLSSAMSHNSVIVSTRPDAGLVARLKGLNRYEILPFNLQQTRNLLEKYALDPKVAAELVYQVVSVPALQALAKIPYLAVLFAESIALTGVPRRIDSPLQWYEAAVRHMLRDTPHARDVQRMLELLAFRAHAVDEAPGRPRQSRFTVASVRETARSQVEDGERASAVADALLASTLVMRTDEDGFGFAHLSLAEYMAACHISQLAEPLELIRRKVTDASLSQQEVLPIALGLIQRQPRAYRLLEAMPDSVDFSILRIRARALRYASRLTPRHAEQVAGDLKRIIVDEEVCFDDTLYKVASDVAGSIDRFASVIVRRVATLLRYKDANVRRRAALTLGAIRSRHAVDLLSNALTDPEREIQAEAAKALGDIGDPSCVPALQDAYLHDKGRTVFQEAVEALVKISGPQAVTALSSILNETTFFKNLRWPVARALGELADPTAFDALLKALADEAESVRESAAQALGALGDLSAVPALCRLLTDAEASVRRASAEALGRLRAREAAADLLKTLRDSHAAVRGAAAESLMQIDRPGLTRALGEIIRDKNGSWRGEAASLLAKVSGRPALPLLLLLAKDRDDEVRQGAANGLTSIAEEEAAEGLLSLMDDRSPDVRWNAAYGLGRMQYGPAVSALVRCLEFDESDLVRCGAASALGSIGDKRAIDALSRALEKGGVTSYYSARALGILGDTRAIPALVAMCKRGRENELMRSWPIHALARIGGPLAAQSLIELLQTIDPEGRRHVVTAVSLLEDPAAVFCLLLGVTDADHVVRVSAREGLRTLPRRTLEEGLRQGIAHADPRVRLEAARLIAFYADEATCLELQEIALTDKDPQVMWAASEALKAYGKKLRPFSQPD